MRLYSREFRNGVKLGPLFNCKIFINETYKTEVIKKVLVVKLGAAIGEKICSVF